MSKQQGNVFISNHEEPEPADRSLDGPVSH